MDALTREQYTSPWWTTHPDNTDGPSAVPFVDDEITQARRRRAAAAETTPVDWAVDNPLGEAQ